MRRSRLLVPAVSLGLLAATLVIAPVQAAPATQDTITPAFTPTLTYLTCPTGEKLPPRTR